MKNRPIYLKILRVAAKAKNGITIPELRQAMPFLDDLTNERLYHGFVKPCVERGWLKRLRWHMRKLGGHEFVVKLGKRTHMIDVTVGDGCGNAATIYKITVKGRRFLGKKEKK